MTTRVTRDACPLLLLLLTDYLLTTDDHCLQAGILPYMVPIHLIITIWMWSDTSVTGASQLLDPPSQVSAPPRQSSFVVRRLSFE